MNRRDYLKFLGAATALAATNPTINFGQAVQTQTPETPAQKADRERRMKWWHEARFGMFIHWGLYSVLGRHEWVMENEGIPVSEYAPLAKQFKPKPFPARDWAKLAKETGMRYMVMTTKHHEGF